MRSLVEMFFDVDDFCHEFLRQCEQKLLSNQGLFFNKLHLQTRRAECLLNWIFGIQH